MARIPRIARGGLVSLALMLTWWIPGESSVAHGDSRIASSAWSGYTDTTLQRAQVRAAELRAGLGGIAVLGVR
jgi:hypothetical protein